MAVSEHYINKRGEQIDFTVYVYTRPNLRSSMDEFFMYQGQRQLEQMFDEGVIDDTVDTIHFEYPERWCNIIELRAIPERMMECFPNLKKVTIKTHSVYIIQCVHRQHIGICDIENRELYKDVGYKDPSVKYCPMPEEFKGLMVFGGSVNESKSNIT